MVFTRNTYYLTVNSTGIITCIRENLLMDEFRINKDKNTKDSYKNATRNTKDRLLQERARTHTIWHCPVTTTTKRA